MFTASGGLSGGLRERVELMWLKGVTLRKRARVHNNFKGEDLLFKNERYTVWLISTARFEHNT